MLSVAREQARRPTSPRPGLAASRPIPPHTRVHAPVEVGGLDDGEAAQLVPGDKNKLDNAVQPGSNVSALTNDAKYLVNPMSTNAPGDMVYTMWSDSSPGAVMNARLPIGTPGQILAAVPGWQNGTGVFPGWIDPASITAYSPANPIYWANPPASLADAARPARRLARSGGRRIAYPQSF